MTYKKSGETTVLLATGLESSGWQIAKGPLRKSSLFTGEYINLQSLASFSGWDTTQGWSDASDNCRGFSGMVRFKDGLPDPIVPSKYPRGHTVSTLDPDKSFITVIYGESIELTRGDINIAGE